MTNKHGPKPNPSRGLVFLRIAILLAIGFLMFCNAPIYSQSILVFSTTHDNTKPTVLSEPDGILKVEISTFSPIVELSVNGKPESPENTTRTSLEIPYSLKDGENTYSVYVKTEAMEERKEFVLSLVEEDEAVKKEDKPFRLVSLLSLTSTSNARNASDNEKADSKYAITLIPRYQLSFSREQGLEFRGILMREKHSDSDYADQEVIYNLITAGWYSESSGSDWKLNLGWEDFGTEQSGASYKTRTETATFVEGLLSLAAVLDKNLTFRGKYALVDQTDEITSDAYDGDGGSLLLGAKWKLESGDIKGSLRGEFESNDSKGKYKDHSIFLIGVSATYAMQKAFNIGGSLQYKQTTYGQSDPLKGDAESSQLMTISLNAGYQFSILGGLIIHGDITQKQKSSNIDGFEYTTSLFTISAIHIY